MGRPALGRLRAPVPGAQAVLRYYCNTICISAIIIIVVLVLLLSLLLIVVVVVLLL